MQILENTQDLEVLEVKTLRPQYFLEDLESGKIPKKSLSYEELKALTVHPIKTKNGSSVSFDKLFDNLDLLEFENERELLKLIDFIHPPIGKLTCFSEKMQIKIQEKYAAEIEGLKVLLNNDSINNLLITPENMLDEFITNSGKGGNCGELFDDDNKVFDQLLTGKAFTSENIKRMHLRYFDKDKLGKIKNQGVNVSPIFYNRTKNYGQIDYDCIQDFGLDVDKLADICVDLESRTNSSGFHFGFQFAKNIDKLSDKLDKNLLMQRFDKCPKVLLKFIESQSISYITNDDIKSYLNSCINNTESVGEEIEALSTLNKRLEPKDQIKTFKKCEDLFGAIYSANSFDIVNKLSKGLTVKELEVIGISCTGEKAIGEIKDYIKKLQNEILNPQTNTQELLSKIENNPLIKDLFKNITRYGNAEWGNSGDIEFDKKINGLQQAFNSSEVKPIDNRFQTQQLEIATKKQDRVEIHSDVIIRTNKLREMIHLAGWESNSLFDIIAEMKTGIKRIIAESQSQLKNSPQANEKYIKNIENKIDQLQNHLNNLKLKNFINNKKGINSSNESKLDIEKISELFSFFSNDQFKAMHPVLTKLTFAVTLKNNPRLAFEHDEMVGEKLKLDQDSVSTKDLNWYINTINHTTLQETWGGVLNKDASKKLRKLVSAQSLDDELKRLTQIEGKSDNTETTLFEPNRGIGMEFSGQLCDACWADKYRSIAEKYPNFTFISLSTMQGESKEKNCTGGFFLIEAKDINGKNLLIVRGLNPQMSAIDKLNVEDFYKRVSEYVRSTAVSFNAKACIVIDDHCGGSASNRPKVYEYLRSVKPNLNKLDVIDGPETNFNGYNISGDIYELN